MAETLDLSKPREVYSFLYGEHLTPEQEAHIIKICAIYQIRPDNVDVLRDIINSGYIRQAERLLGQMQEVTRSSGLSVKTASEMAGNVERMLTEAIPRLEEHNQVFLDQVKKQAVGATKHFWAAISRHMVEYEQISLYQINGRIDAAVVASFEDLQKRAGERARGQVKAIAVTSLLTAGVVLAAVFLVLKR